MIKGRGVVDSGFVDTPESPLTSEWNIPAERDEDIRRRDVWICLGFRQARVLIVQTCMVAREKEDRMYGLPQ